MKLELLQNDLNDIDDKNLADDDDVVDVKKEIENGSDASDIYMDDIIDDRLKIEGIEPFPNFLCAKLPNIINT